MTTSFNVKAFRDDFKFTITLKKNYYETFRDKLELKDWLEYNQMIKMNGNKPISPELFKKTFDSYDERTYNLYNAYVYWYNQKNHLSKRSKFKLIHS